MSTADDSPIEIRIQDQNGEQTMFKIKKSTSLGKVFKAHATRKGVEVEELRFLFYGERVHSDDTPHMWNLEDGDQIDCILQMIGMISTFTSNDATDPLVNYLMLTDEERVTAPVPIQELKEKEISENANDKQFTYKQNPDILHPSQLAVLCELLDFVWDKTAVAGVSRVDMRLTLTSDHFVAILSPLDHSLADKYNSTCLDEKFRNINGEGGGHRHKIALRMTKGPTNSCINFHCDGGYATSTSQIPLNPTSEYDGGSLLFFFNDHLHPVPRIPGSLVQHPRKILHGVASVTRGTRKSLFIVDYANGLGEGGVVELTSDHIVSFLADRATRCREKKRQREG